MQQRLHEALIAIYFASRAYYGTTTFPHIGNKIQDAGVITNGLWVPVAGGGFGVSLDGLGDYITLQDNLLDNRPNGTVVIHCSVTDPGAGNTAQVVGDISGGVEAFRLQAVSTAARITWWTNDGVAQTLSASSKMRWDEWITIGCEWGAAGKRTFLNGAQVASSAGTAGSGASGQALRLGEAAGAYADMVVKAFGFFDRPIGIANHVWLDELFRRAA